MREAQPWFALEAGALLPPGWQADLAALAAGPDQIALITEPGWSFAVVPGDAVTRRLDWLWRLYHGALREFASRCFARPLFASNRRDSTLTLNVLCGPGATNDWHCDANPVTGVLFGSSLDVADGGALEFRGDDTPAGALQPRAGTFVCFAGPHEHRVAPLTGTAPRLAVSMTYYHSAEAQPFANPADRYDMPA